MNESGTPIGAHYMLASARDRGRFGDLSNAPDEMLAVFEDAWGHLHDILKEDDT